MHKEQWEEIAKYGNRLEGNLKRLNETKDEIVKLQGMLDFAYRMNLDDLKVSINRLSDRFHLLEKQLAKYGIPHVDYYDFEFTQMRKIAESTEWPLAVPETNYDDAYEKRKVESILDFIVIDPVLGKKVLDFGCGNGALAREINHRKSKLSVGYDPIVPEFKTENLVLTQERSDVSNHAPFDIIVLYDVLDHCQDPIEIMKFIESIADNRTKVIIRNHPYCSRHGKHLFTTLNRAFLHMFFDEMELMRLCGQTGLFTLPILRPVPEYRKWIGSTQFETISETLVTSPIEPFFMNPDNYLLRDRVLSKYEGEDPTRHMKIDFVDYILQKRSSVII